jgi:hypothetical protein
LLYFPSDNEVIALVISAEGGTYHACTFAVANARVVYRKAKMTPTKSGQFVTVWKRDSSKLTVPYHENDPFDCFVITVVQEQKIGQFIFPKAILTVKGIISSNGKSGKRGIRVYAPWDVVTSKQALSTQKWQANYFHFVDENNATYIKSSQELF